MFTLFHLIFIMFSWFQGLVCTFYLSAFRDESQGVFGADAWLTERQSSVDADERADVVYQVQSENKWDTVDGRNPAPPGMYKTL